MATYKTVITVLHSNREDQQDAEQDGIFYANRVGEVESVRSVDCATWFVSELEEDNPYIGMSQQDLRRELSGTEFWNEDKGDRN